jgi:phosphoribosylamine--glycine ligase
VIIPRIKSDFFELIEGVAKGDLSSRKLEIDDRFVTTVMLVSGGYPGNYEKGKSIKGLDLTEGSVIFHSGTRKEEDRIVTSGGRVLAVSSWGSTMKEALEKSYSNAAKLKFEGSYCRTDIGFDL